jgi:hypothetical protein
MRCICWCGMVLMMHVRMTRLPICVSDCKGNQSRERIYVTSCYLTTKIPSALLVAVVWLQHTRYPRFRRGTFDYGVTTSSNQRGRVGVQSFMRMHVSIPMLPKCICYAAHAQKQHFKSNHKVWARPKETSSGLRNRLDLWLAQNSWSTDLDWSQLSTNNVLQRSLLEEMFNQGSTSMRVFRITKQHLEIQCGLVAMSRFLVQPTTIVDQKWSWYTRIPYKTALSRLGFYSWWTNFRGWDLACWRTTVTRVQTQFQIHLGYPQHLLLALVQEW